MALLITVAPIRRRLNGAQHLGKAFVQTLPYVFSILL